jgi:hypothetical protein
MIALRPEIIGPGIEEEYQDAMAAIADLRRALSGKVETNSTPEGRLLLELRWIAQEIDSRRLPIPVDKSFVGTVFYLIGSNELSGISGVEDPLGRLWLVLKGYGLMKARHVPVLIAMMEDFLQQAEPLRPRLTEREVDMLEDMRVQITDLKRGGAWPKPRRPQDNYIARSRPTLQREVDHGFEKLRDISCSLFEGWRPRPAYKGPLAAPVPGLPREAPPLPAELANQLP